MNQEDLFYTLALLYTEGIGCVTSRKLIHNFTSPKEIFQASKKSLLCIDGIGEALYKKLKQTDNFRAAEKEIQFIEKENIIPIYFQDELYPSLLKQCHDSPVLLFQSGNISIQNQKIINIVGTRNITTYGTEFTKKLVEELQPLNPIIVSGFAYGVDIVAHQAAMEHKLQTIGVLGHGLDQIYPKVHKKYMAKMEENGGFLTEFWSTTKPDRENFVKRNRIVAGMCEATIVIESAEKGGSLITAQYANDYNRDVFAVPGRTTDKYSQGCNNLIKTQRAHLVNSVADLIYILNWDIQQKQKVIQKQLFIQLEPEEELVINYLNTNGKEHMDLIAIGCDLPIYRISTLLLTLELKGMIRPLPGKLFEVV